MPHFVAALEDAEDAEAFDAAMAEEGPNIPWDQAKADLGLGVSRYKIELRPAAAQALRNLIYRSPGEYKLRSRCLLRIPPPLPGPCVAVQHGGYA